MGRRIAEDRFRSAEQVRCSLGAVTQLGWTDKRRPMQGFERGFRYFGLFAVVVLIDGHGQYEDDRGTHEQLEPGDVTLILPDLGHRFGPRQGCATHEGFIVFDGPAFDAWQAGGLIDADRPIVHTGEPMRWAQRLRDVVDARASTPLDAAGEVCRVEQLLHALLARQVEADNTVDGSAWLQRAIDEIEATIPGDADWNDLARRLHVSPPTLRRRFRAGTGLSPGRFRTRRLIDRACDMMQRTDLTDQEIADALGFCDAFYFSRCFKNTLGRSPSAYRKALP